VGGLLSGFFGGLSGNQGALRSAFLGARLEEAEKWMQGQHTGFIKMKSHACKPRPISGDR
jgi:hypothetical protein